MALGVTGTRCAVSLDTFSSYLPPGWWLLSPLTTITKACPGAHPLPSAQGLRGPVPKSSWGSGYLSSYPATLWFPMSGKGHSEQEEAKPSGRVEWGLFLQTPGTGPQDSTPIVCPLVAARSFDLEKSDDMLRKVRTPPPRPALFPTPSLLRSSFLPVFPPSSLPPSLPLFLPSFLSFSFFLSCNDCLLSPKGESSWCWHWGECSGRKREKRNQINK